MSALTPNRFAAALAGVAGYVDTLGFVALYGLFTAHVTGNFVLIGSELSKPSHSVLLKFLAFPAFVGAVALSRLLSIWSERMGIVPLRGLLIFEASAMASFMISGIVAEPIASSSSNGAILTGILGAVAMGVQNGMARLELTKLTPTTVMTGNVTQLVIDLVDWAMGRSNPKTLGRIASLSWPVATFGVGAVAGATAFIHFGFVAVAPALVTVALLALLADQLRFDS